MAEFREILSMQNLNTFHSYQTKGISPHILGEVSDQLKLYLAKVFKRNFSAFNLFCNFLHFLLQHFTLPLEIQ